MECCDERSHFAGALWTIEVHASRVCGCSSWTALVVIADTMAGLILSFLMVHCLLPDFALGFSRAISCLLT